MLMNIYIFLAQVKDRKGQYSLCLLCKTTWNDGDGDASSWNPGLGFADGTS